MHTDRPFLPARYAPPSTATPDYLTRGAFSLAKAQASRRNVLDTLHELYPDERLTRAVVERATTAIGTTTGWGASVVQTLVSNFLGALSAQSAAATLIQSSVRLTLGENGHVLVPLRPSGPTAPSWVTEGGAIAVRQNIFDTVQLGPARKLGVIVVATRELLQRSDAANVFAQTLREDAATGLDGAVFSAEDGSGDPIAGLLNNATIVSGSGYLADDLRALAYAAGTGGSGRVAFVAGTGTAAAIATDNTINATVLPSPAVPESRLIAVDPASIAWAFGEDIQISASTEAVVHMSDPALQIVDSGTSDPTRSLYQTDCTALKLILPVAFVKRRAAAVAYTDDAAYWS